ncbi:hypothetical protein OAE54_01170, partial [bacterium]|nr:hypothetical protein [bacterium]
MNNLDENQLDDDDDVQNDAVIASALRASLVVFMILGIPVIAALVYLNMGVRQEDSTESEVTLPKQRE